MLCSCSYGCVSPVCGIRVWLFVSEIVVPILTAMFVPTCGQYLGGRMCHKTLPALLSAGVCHIMCVVSGCGCRFQSLLGVVSHPV